MIDDKIYINYTSVNRTNPKSIKKKFEVIKLIDKHGGLKGNVLDIGERNYFTEDLEKRYNIHIDSTKGDLDIQLNCPKKKYDFVIYSDVIEHQFNPLFTILGIKKIIKNDGMLILSTPLKPKWITSAKCHFHEFDRKTYNDILYRSDLKEIESSHFYYHVSIKGLRPFVGSFFKRQIVSILKFI